MPTDLHVDDVPKMLRETFCVAQALTLRSDDHRRVEHADRLQRLIDECDRHRPLGRGGKHGDLHTPTCGCDDVPADHSPLTPAAAAADEVQHFIPHEGNTGLGDIYALAIGVIFRRCRRNPEAAAEIVASVEAAVREAGWFASNHWPEESTS